MKFSMMIFILLVSFSVFAQDAPAADDKQTLMLAIVAAVAAIYECLAFSKLKSNSIFQLVGNILKFVKGDR